MTMDILPLHIEYLLTRHDCVIVPGIGAFIASESESSIDFSSGVLTPRHREVSFNGSVVTDDGLLSHSIARSERLSYEEAHRFLFRHIERMKADLASEGEVSLGMVGRLLKEEEGLLRFEPRQASALSEVFTPLRIEALEREEDSLPAAETPTGPSSDGTVTEEDGTRIIRVAPDRYVFTVSKRAVHAAAMFITLFTVGLSLLIPINHDQEQKASVISFDEFFRPTPRPAKTHDSIIVPSDSVPDEIREIRIDGSQLSSD